MRWWELLFRYKMRVGMLAWLFHRISGLALVGYIIVHVYGLRTLTDRDQFNALIAGYHHPLFRVLEIFLLAAVTYHALNGLRIVLIDFLGWSPQQKRLFWTLSGAAVLIIGLGAYPILRMFF
ncbi:MAG: succinate dehydrogenase, cytochrome b556 subunit [Bacteroidetes bacterium]|nr:succinate dehydrogenase, cytochrome b556 subunit [Rhodothermia bacterium]MCS7155974.1 succinate dehydrogenase, cytochrome b556 subunit [Bacteroidota bacterium]MCX7907662.1 succinate dehydrogenase, cytochrome b556 subunit [Bacteroidota bacterium]MDW8137791.1 succinate dehydrogenase, cytochrome b556 subunit [Bacteroidota bacterium]MDW8286358.1 succinate dehydrogenase, cytochrome b556 subunit [Bacteroidota bacterium]